MCIVRPNPPLFFQMPDGQRSSGLPVAPRGGSFFSMPPKRKTSRQNAADKLPEPEYLRVGDAAALISMSAKSLRECLQDIPGVVKISQRGIRIPRAGLLAWVRQFEIAR